MRLALLCLTALCAPLFAATVPLNVANPSGLAATASPVTTGVPFPAGKLASAQQVRLLDEQGREIPLQALCTGKHPDGSVRWLLLDFQTDVPAAGRKLSLEYGPTVKRAAIAKPIRVDETRAAITVDAGRLQVTFDRRRCDGLHTATLDGKPFLTAGHNGGAYFVTDDGQEFQALREGSPEVNVESEGPLRTVVTTRGWYVNAAGDRKCQFIIRYHFHAGQPYVRVAYTWLMTEDSRKLRFRDIGFRLPVRSTACGFVLEDGQALTAPLAADKPAGLVQYDYDKYKLLSGAAVPAAQPLGLVTTQGPQVSCGVAVRDFRQLFPKEFTATPTGLAFHLWPAHGVPNPARKVEDANLQYAWFAHEGEVLDFQPPEAFHNHKEGLSDNDYRYLRSSQNANAMGLAKTHDLLFVFGAPAASPAAAVALTRTFQNPPAALADPQWMCDSGVFGAMQPYSPQQFAKYETMISDTFDAERRMEAATRDYGLWNYGDSHTSWNPTTRRWSDAYRCWRNTHHGAPRVPWLLYVRSGDPKYLAYGLRNARHVLDVDFCHYSTPEFEALDYPRGKLKGALNDYKGIVHWHSGNRLMDYNSMTDFALWYYHLTGDRWGLEVAQEWGEAVKAKFTAPFGYRSGTGTMSALVDLYTETNDESYRPLIEAFFTHLTTKVQNWDGNSIYSDHVLSYWPQYKDRKTPVGAFSEWENYAPWIERYWDLTHSDAAKRSLVAWADAYLQGYGDMTSLWDTREYINILAYAYLVTGDPKYLGRGVWELDRIAASVNQGVEDPLLKGLIMTGQVSLSGYVVQRLPAFMKALAQHGQPVTRDPLIRSGMGFQLLFERTRPTINGKPSKVETTECLLLDARDEAFTVTAHTTHTYDQRTYWVSLVGPDGKEVHKREERIPKGAHDFVVQVPADGLKGVYRLSVGGEGGMGRVQDPLEVSPALPMAYPLPGRLVPFEGARYFVYVPAGAREVTATLEMVNAGTVTMQVTDPDGARRAVSPEAGKVGLTVTLTPTAAQTGKAWELVTTGGYGTVRLTVDGQPGAQLFFPAAYPAEICQALSAAVR